MKEKTGQAEAATAQAAADAATQAARSSAMTTEQQAQRDAEQREIEMLKAEIAAEQEAAAGRSAVIEQQREDALEKARQLELIAMANGRAEEMTRLQDAETARQQAQMEAAVEAETLATRQEEQAAADAAAVSTAISALPTPIFEPVTKQSPTSRPPTSKSFDAPPASTLTMTDRAAALAEAPTPRPTAEVSAGKLSDRQLVLGQAALSTLTERLEEMHRTNPSLLGTARFDALCNTIGDYSQNPTSASLEDLVKTTVRLAGSFKSDAMFAKQLQRKVFPGIGKDGSEDKQGLQPARQLTGAAEHTSNLVSSLQTEVVTLRQEIMRLGSVIDVSSPRLSPRASPEEDRVYSRIAEGEGDRAAKVTAIAQNLMGSAEELEEPTEESAEASVRSLFEQRPAESKQRNTDRSFAGRLLTLQAQLDQGLITEAQYSDEKRRLSQLAAAPSSPMPELAEATPTPRRHGAPRIKKDVARSLALACLLRQVSIGELLPIVRSHLGVASISELEELEPADLNAVSLSPLHRRRLLRALDYVKNDIVRDALLEGERMARAGDIQGAIQQCRHALTLGPGGLAPSPTPRKPEPADEEDDAEDEPARPASPYRSTPKTAERGEGSEVHDHNDPESDFFCDATGQTLRLGAWWHKVGQSYDLCADEFRKLPAGSARAGFILVTKLSDLGNDRHRYGHGTATAATAEEGVPPPSGGHGKPTAPVRPPANRQLRQDIEKMAAYVMRHGGIGGDFDQIARRKQQSNPRFAFMFGGEGSLYYSYVTTELTRRVAVSAAPPGHGLASAQKM